MFEENVDNYKFKLSRPRFSVLSVIWFNKICKIILTKIYEKMVVEQHSALEREVKLLKFSGFWENARNGLFKWPIEEKWSML